MDFQFSISDTHHVIKLLIEDTIPLDKVNETARVEAGFIRVPKVSNLHPYLARRPTAPARILSLASVLPANLLKEEFERAIGLDRIGSVPFKLLYLVNPDREYVKEVVKKYTGKEPKEFVIVDPMAGGGSIPLEALRLGFYTIAVDYNPVSYLILKATLDYPAKYAQKLYEDVKKEVEKLIDWVKKELASKYYIQDNYDYTIAKGYRCYIIARGYKCPNPGCRKLIPIIHSNKLSDKGPYIKIVTEKEKNGFTVEISQSEIPFERLKCPYCGTPISDDVALKSWVKKHKELLEVALNGDLKNAKEKIEELLETHILLVKDTPQGFKSVNDPDRKAFIKAFLDLTVQINELRDFLPDAQIPKENEVFNPIRNLGIEYWYELFNPRQLIILLKLMKYLKERAENLIKENGEYGAAIALYLALGISKYMNFSNISTRWDYSTSTIENLTNYYLERKSITIGLEYCDAMPIKTIDWTFEPYVTSIGRTTGGILPVLNLLAKWLEGLCDRINVLCGDARRLDLMLKDQGIESVDVIHVDPPYLSQHFYSDLMEFFWQFLRIMLEPAINKGYLFNRDPIKGKVELYIDGWSPDLPALPREAEIIARKGKDKIMKLIKKSPEIVERNTFTGDWYMLKMWEFFDEAQKILKDDGVFILWFTHSDPRAWEAILASLYASDLVLVKAWPIWTEMKQKREVLLKSAFFTSLALVFKKKSIVESIITDVKKAEELVQEEDAKRIIKLNVSNFITSAINARASGSEIFIMGLAGGIAGATRIWKPSIDELSEAELHKPKTLTKYAEGIMVEKLLARNRFKKATEFFDEVLYPVAIYLASEALLEEYLAKSGLDERMFKYVFSADNFTKAYLILWTATRYSGERELAYDFVEKVCKILNVDLQSLAIYGLISRLSGSAKQNRLLLLFGSESYDAVKGQTNRLVKTTVGQAIHLLRLIGEQPKEDVSKVVKEIIQTMPTSRSAITTALFLLYTASDEELQLVKLSETVKGFVKDILMKLYQGV